PPHRHGPPRRPHRGASVGGSGAPRRGRRRRGPLRPRCADPAGHGRSLPARRRDPCRCAAGRPPGRRRGMKAVISRVTGASVTVEGEVVGALPGPGLLALVGVSADDDERDVETMVRKIAELRILAGERSAVDVGAPVLVVSQFTLLGSTAKGRRPSWSRAARGDVAEPMVESVVLGLRERGLEVATGAFGAMMQVHSTNDGPFTVLV